MNTRVREPLSSAAVRLSRSPPMGEEVLGKLVCISRSTRESPGCAAESANREWRCRLARSRGVLGFGEPDRGAGGCVGPGGGPSRVINELPPSGAMKGVHAMTHGHSALLAGLDQLRSASPGAVFGELIRAGLQELIEAEATAVIGAARYKRSDGRTVQRNGHRPKQWLVVANGRRKPSARLRPGRDGSRRQAARLPLPPVAPATGWRVSTRLARDHHVRIDSNDYSVCPAVIGRRIELIVNLRMVKRSARGALSPITRGSGPGIRASATRSIGPRPWSVVASGPGCCDRSPRSALISRSNTGRCPTTTPRSAWTSTVVSRDGDTATRPYLARPRLARRRSALG